MKKIIVGTVAAFMAILFGFGIIGCDEVPSSAKISVLSKSIGLAAGYAVDASKLSSTEKSTIIEIVDIIADVVPTNGQTFAEAWNPVITETIQKFVSSGKINASASTLILQTLSVATQGIDYMFEVRWPKLREYADLTSIAVSNFIDGFKTVLSTTSTFAAAQLEYDETEFKTAQKWFSTNLIK